MDPKIFLLGIILGVVMAYCNSASVPSLRSTRQATVENISNSIESNDMKFDDTYSDHVNNGDSNTTTNVDSIELKLPLMPPHPQNPPLFRPNESPASDTNQPELIYPPCEPTTKLEMEDFTENLFGNDTNNAYKYITLNSKGRENDKTINDNLGQLLEVNEEAYKIPTIRALLLLHDNFKLNAKLEEKVSPADEIEEENLIDQFLETEVMRMTMEFLVAKNCMSPSKQLMKKHLKSIWFTRYSMFRNDKGSSGFESVFLAEVQDSTIFGMHNWVYYAKQEEERKLKYFGFVNEKKLGNRGALVTVRSMMMNAVQEGTTIFVGTSPELEMALYTLCFFTHPMMEACPIKLGDTHFTIQASRFNIQGREIMLSAFPII